MQAAQVMGFLWKFINPKSLAWTEGVVIILVLSFAWIQHDRIQAQKAELLTVRTSLVNPRVSEKVRTRVITRIVEKPTGEKETTINETTEAKNEETPVPVSALQARPIPNRWLLSVGVNRLTPDFEGKMILAGYGWWNRVDVQAGIINKDGISPWLVSTIRF